jgi:hypothetical protein
MADTEDTIPRTAPAPRFPEPVAAACDAFKARFNEWRGDGKPGFPLPQAPFNGGGPWFNVPHPLCFTDNQPPSKELFAGCVYGGLKVHVFIPEKTHPQVRVCAAARICIAIQMTMRHVHVLC